MTTEIEIKDQLRKIAQNNYALRENADPFPLALEMMDHIGAVDSELRDDLIYTTLGTWIVRRKLFNDSELRQLLTIVLDDRHLFYRIGETNTDSVFTRAFSVLQLPLLLIRHRETPFLSPAEIKVIKESVIKYLAKEQDLRGYDTERGWAHGTAHAADALDDLARCYEMDSADLLEMLYCIADKMSFDGIPYVYDEDERMVTAVIAILDQQLVDDAEVERWIGGLVTKAKGTKPILTSFRQRNIKTFLRSLYFRMIQKKMSEPSIQMVLNALQEINHFTD